LNCRVLICLSDHSRRACVIEADSGFTPGVCDIPMVVASTPRGGRGVRRCGCRPHSCLSRTCADRPDCLSRTCADRPDLYSAVRQVRKGTAAHSGGYARALITMPLRRWATQSDDLSAYSCAGRRAGNARSWRGSSVPCSVAVWGESSLVEAPAHRLRRARLRLMRPFLHASATSSSPPGCRRDPGCRHIRAAPAVTRPPGGPSVLHTGPRPSACGLTV
jgi:hypothetical protein